MRSDASSSFCPCPFRVLCHEQRRSKRRCVTVRKMKESPSGSAIRSLIPSHRELLRSKAVVVSAAETPGQSSRQAIAPSMSRRGGRELPLRSGLDKQNPAEKSRGLKVGGLMRNRSAA